MHGFMFLLSPEFFGGHAVMRREKQKSPTPHYARKNRPPADETEMEFCLAVTLAIALVINIALTIHYVG